MTKIRFTVPDDLADWVNLRVAEGGFASSADYLFDLVRREMEGPTP